MSVARTNLQPDFRKCPLTNKYLKLRLVLQKPFLDAFLDRRDSGSRSASRTGCLRSGERADNWRASRQDLEGLKRGPGGLHDRIWRASRPDELRGECGRERGVTFHQREELIEEIEENREKMRALNADLQAILDEKEEIVIARDAYRFKVHRLNHEIQALLNSKATIDIDGLIMENK
ncbi:unnamed protein product [Nesidiocoris tenuis]|uniref:Uncharacterized protein n=1 Tax=Nesidiocoris tenuis TaxID=355587 RepID=A0A6H5GSY0_9HEMI|nr:unnamed protein product [Nesidiocoris tenuis]